jgi:hypothetical protein
MQCAGTVARLWVSGTQMLLDPAAAAPELNVDHGFGSSLRGRATASSLHGQKQIWMAHQHVCKAGVFPTLVDLVHAPHNIGRTVPAGRERRRGGG